MTPETLLQLQASLAKARVTSPSPWKLSYRWHYDYGDRVLDIDFSLGQPSFLVTSQRPSGHEIVDAPGRISLSELRFFLRDARARMKASQE